MSDKMECPICCSKYTSTKRKRIDCPTCDGSCCLECFTTFLSTSDHPSPKCMHCDGEISQSFVRSHCSLHFCNKDLLEKRTGMEYNRQMTLLPNSQPLAQLKLERKKYYQELMIYDNRIAELRREISDIEHQRRSVPWPVLDDIVDEQKEEGKRGFVQKCLSDDCNGFLSTKWKCGICEKSFCNRCHLEKIHNEEHVCDEELVANISAIRRDSKPCPKCGNYIYKIDGCDQMFDPACGTAFSWRTGKIETGTIHNPHYYEWLRETQGSVPRNPGDLPPCEQIPHWWRLTRMITTWKDRTSGTVKMRRQILQTKISNLHRYIEHVRRVVIPRVNIDYHGMCEDMRVKFLLKEIDEPQMKLQLKKLIKKEEKNGEARQIYNLYLTVCEEILKNIIHTIDEDGDTEIIVTQLGRVDEIKTYCNEKLSDVEYKFKNRTYKLETLKE